MLGFPLKHIAIERSKILFVHYIHVCDWLIDLNSRDHGRDTLYVSDLWPATPSSIPGWDEREHHSSSTDLLNPQQI